MFSISCPAFSFMIKWCRILAITPSLASSRAFMAFIESTAPESIFSSSFASSFFKDLSSNFFTGSIFSYAFFISASMTSTSFGDKTVKSFVDSPSRDDPSDTSSELPVRMLLAMLAWVITSPCCTVSRLYLSPAAATSCSILRIMTESPSFTSPFSASIWPLLSPPACKAFTSSSIFSPRALMSPRYFFDSSTYSFCIALLMAEFALPRPIIRPFLSCALLISNKASCRSLRVDFNNSIFLSFDEMFLVSSIEVTRWAERLSCRPFTFESRSLSLPETSFNFCPMVLFAASAPSSAFNLASVISISFAELLFSSSKVSVFMPPDRVSRASWDFLTSSRDFAASARNALNSSLFFEEPALTRSAMAPCTARWSSTVLSWNGVLLSVR